MQLINFGSPTIFVFTISAAHYQWKCQLHHYAWHGVIKLNNGNINKLTFGTKNKKTIVNNPTYCNLVLFKTKLDNMMESLKPILGVVMTNRVYIMCLQNNNKLL